VSREALLDPAPPEIINVTRGHLRSDEEEIIRVAADVLPDGAFGPQWVIATRARVMAVARKRVIADVPLREIASVRAEPLVGGGCLEVCRTDGPPLRVQHSASLRMRFLDVARGIEGLREARSLVPQHTERGRCGRCGRRLPEPNSVCPACLSRVATLRKVMTFVKPYYRRTLLLALASGGITLASLVPPLITRRVVDEVLGPETTTDVSGEGLTRLGVLVLGLLLVQCTTWAVQWGQGWGATWLGARITADVRAALYRCLEMLSLKVYDTRTTGALMARVTAAAGTLEHFLIRGLPHLIIHALTFVGVLAVMVWMNWQLALVVLVPRAPSGASSIALARVGAARGTRPDLVGRSGPGVAECRVRNPDHRRDPAAAS
jgi:ATP-binding cassette, subfamily B, bacterial